MALFDEFGREVTGLCVSLTDRCNFDCVYCHNERLCDTRGPMGPQDEEMTADEVVRTPEVVVDLAVQRVSSPAGRMPRADLEEIVQHTPADTGVSMTTSGSFLPGRGAGLVDAGLTPVKLNVVVFEPTAGYMLEVVDHVAGHDGLWLQLIEYVPEIAGHPEWAIDIGRVHDWLADRADRIERPEMHHRTRRFLRPATKSRQAKGRPTRGARDSSRQSTRWRTQSSARTVTGSGSPTTRGSRAV